MGLFLKVKVCVEEPPVAPLPLLVSIQWYRQSGELCTVSLMVVVAGNWKYHGFVNVYKA